MQFMCPEKQSKAFKSNAKLKIRCAKQHNNYNIIIIDHIFQIIVHIVVKTQ